jgi:hypothetical protein
MYKHIHFFLIAFVSISFTQLYAQDEENYTESSQAETDTLKEKTFDFTLRLGQGGFTDSRSPNGRLGGGQLTLDIKPGTLPIALSISSEYYANSNNPTHSYEIASMLSVNVLYMPQFFNIERVKLFMGGGIGWLEVTGGEEDPDASVRSSLYNIEAGINVRAFWKIGFYGLYKYLNAQKNVNDIQVIDFNENIILLGISFSFSI